jgi:deoxyribodipyrimidine photo-lyase
MRMDGVTTAVLWFRRDLRLHDLPALAAAADATVLAPLFVLDETLLRGGVAANRVWFMLETLRELDAALRDRGSRLHVRRGRPVDVVPAFAREIDAADVHVSRDYTPYGRRRDRRVHEALDADGRVFGRHPGVLVHEPESIAGGADGHYTVYSPFRRAWDRLDVRPLAALPDRLPPPPDVDPGVLPAAADLGAAPTADPDLLPRPGEAAARDRLERWLDGGIAGYDRTRDRLDEDGTSRLSQDLRFGLVSPVEVVTRAAGGGEGRRRFRAEIAWRDFYAHVLWHEPALLRASFRPEMDGAFASGAGSTAAIDAWREGRTGYPIVDAAMRQLHATGWMHNRARMVVASFLTKHLLVDRRVGEAEFWRHLTDGDLASNNGGWQWAASTGTDPQPWFRIFNPILQGRRFDPDGAYVRRWVPELARVPGPAIHAPWELSDAEQDALGVRIGRDYPAPIVGHAEARERALAALSAAGSPGRRDEGPQPTRRASQPVSPRRTS